MPAHDLFCLLTLPAGLAVAFKGPPVTSVLSTLMEHCSEMVIMALKNESYIMPVATPEPAGALLFSELMNSKSFL